MAKQKARGVAPKGGKPDYSGDQGPTFKGGGNKSVGGAEEEVRVSGDMQGGDGDWNVKVPNQSKNQGFAKTVRSAGGNQTGNAYSTIKRAQKGESDY